MEKQYKPLDHTYVLSVIFDQEPNPRNQEQKLEEICGLSEAIALAILDARSVRLRKIAPSTLFTKGILEDIQAVINEKEIDLVIIDCPLSPVQHRNLERKWKVKVLDRIGLILEIFGERAKTYEGRLQVELAALTYQRSRLVRSWTHLERQRGGFGFTGGPGETQIELDRRLIDQRIQSIKKDLSKVERTRDIQRKSRQKVPFPAVALVGYTNAGKSTLFNRLTEAKVMAKDMLFATLDTTVRKVTLPSGQAIILSDTVGFISDLPHDLVKAFKATLEETLQADIILHVRDASSSDTDLQKQDVMGVLNELLGEDFKTPIIDVLNKIDLISESEKKLEKSKKQIPLSAINGEGVEDLLLLVDNVLSSLHKIMDITLSPWEGQKIAWLYEHAHVMKRNDEEEKIILKVSISPIQLARFQLLS